MLNIVRKIFCLHKETVNYPRKFIIRRQKQHIRGKGSLITRNPSIVEPTTVCSFYSVDLSTDAGFDQEFVDSDPQVEMALKSVEAAEGYTMFTVGYPMTVELIGPGT